VPFDAWEEIMFGMTGGGGWFGTLAGGLAIAAGVYSFLRARSVAGWLQSQEVPHSLPTAVFLRQIKTLGVLFILAGGFFLFVAARIR
jgi:hypothetical protein